MDAVSVKSQEWNDGILMLELEGVAGTTESYRFHVLFGYKLNTCSCNNGTANVNCEGETIEVELSFKGKTCLLRLEFDTL